MKRPLVISLSPNTEKEDVFAALRMFFSPFQYKKGNAIKSLEQLLTTTLATKNVTLFASGRAALFAIFSSMSIGKGDDVLLQAFTCIVVPNAIIASGARPIYVDINKDLTLDISDLKKKITKKTKAILLQYTFGIPSDITEIEKLAKQHNIFIIEDCAHVLGDTFRGKKLGTFGDAGFYSLGRDKPFSSVFGGIAVTNNDALAEKIKSLHKNLPFPTYRWIAQQLFHPLAFFLILLLYPLGSLGKVFLVFLQKIHALSLPVTAEEKKGKQRKELMKKMPNALAYLALVQLKRMKQFNAHRQLLASYYLSALQNTQYIPVNTSILSYLRFPIVTKNRDAVFRYLKKHGIYLGNWYANTIDPKGSDFVSVFYAKGSCTSAEALADIIINLPTYPTCSLSDAKRIVQLLKTYDNN